MSELGMDRATGRPLAGRAHMVQSIFHILTTRLGTRGAYRRHYGSRVPDFVDRLAVAGDMLLLFAETAQALADWEDRFRLTRVQAEQVARGRVRLMLTGIEVATGENLTFGEEVSL